MSAVDAALEAGWQRVKLYFMVGLPTETDEDVRRSAGWRAMPSLGCARLRLPPIGVD